MKTVLSTLLLLFSLVSLRAQNVVVFTDANLKAALVADDVRVNTNNDSEIQLSEALACDRIKANNKNITSLTDLKDFVNLELLRVNGNSISSADLRGFTKLRILEIKDNPLNTLLLAPSCSTLEEVLANNGQLTSLDFPSTSPKLEEIDLSNNQLNSLTLSSNLNKLKTINVNNNQLTSLDLTSASPQALQKVYANNNKLTQLISLISGVRYLECRNNKLSKIHISGYYKHLDIGHNLLDSLRIASSVRIEKLQCDNNKLVYIDLNANVDILDCSHNLINYIEFNGVYEVKRMNASFNKIENFISVIDSWEYLNLENNQLKTAGIYNNSTSSNVFDAHFTNNPDLKCIETNVSIPNAQNNWSIPSGAIITGNNGCYSIWNSTEVLATLPNASLYPNPTSDQVQLDLGDTYEQANVTIYNSLGQVVQHLQFQQIYQTTVALPNVAGIYNIKVQTEKGQTSFRVIKK